MDPPAGQPGPPPYDIPEESLSAFSSSSPAISPSFFPSNPPSSNSKTVLVAVLLTAVLTTLIIVSICFIYKKLRPKIKGQTDSNFSTTYDNPLLETDIRSHFWRFHGPPINVVSGLPLKKLNISTGSVASKPGGNQVANMYASDAKTGQDSVLTWSISQPDNGTASKQSTSYLVEVERKEQESHIELGHMERVGPLGFRGSSTQVPLAEEKVPAKQSPLCTTINGTLETWRPMPGSSTRPPQSATVVPWHSTHGTEQSVEMSDSSIFDTLDFSFDSFGPNAMAEQFFGISSDQRGCAKVGSIVPLTAGMPGVGRPNMHNLGGSVTGIMDQSLNTKLGTHAQSWSNTNSLDVLSIDQSLALAAGVPTSELTRHVLAQKRTSFNAAQILAETFGPTASVPISAPPVSSSLPSVTASSMLQPWQKASAAISAVHNFTPQPVQPLPLPPALVSASILKTQREKPEIPAVGIHSSVPVKSVAVALSKKSAEVEVAPPPSSADSINLSVPVKAVAAAFASQAYQAETLSSYSSSDVQSSIAVKSVASAFESGQTPQAEITALPSTQQLISYGDIDVAEMTKFYTSQMQSSLYKDNDITVLTGNLVGQATAKSSESPDVLISDAVGSRRWPIQSALAFPEDDNHHNLSVSTAQHPCPSISLGDVPHHSTASTTSDSSSSMLAVSNFNSGSLTVLAPGVEEARPQPPQNVKPPFLSLGDDSSPPSLLPSPNGLSPPLQAPSSRPPSPLPSIQDPLPLLSPRPLPSTEVPSPSAPSIETKVSSSPSPALLPIIKAPYPSPPRLPSLAPGPSLSSTESPPRLPSLAPGPSLSSTESPPSPTPTPPTPSLNSKGPHQPAPPPLPVTKGPAPPSPPPLPGTKSSPPPLPGTKKPPAPPPPPLAGTKGPPPPPPPNAKGPPLPPPRPPGPPGGKAPPPPLPGSASHAPSMFKPPQAPQQEPAENLQKLKPLHWDKVRADPSHSMVWDRLKTGSFELNEDEIAALFGTKPSVNKEASKAPMPPRRKSILDAKKAQNIAIQLRALNISTQDICDALLEGAGMKAELLEVLVKMAPTQEEQKALLDFSSDRSELGPAERFLKAVLEIPNAFQRLQAMQFKACFKDDMCRVQEQLQILEGACVEVRENRLFLKILEAVLKTGNRMNKGTNRGEAEAFKLDTLLRLSDVKGGDGKTTLLQFVVEGIIKSEGLKALHANDNALSNGGAASEGQKNENEIKRRGLEVVWKLFTELGSIKNAAAVDADALNQSMLRLVNGLQSIENRLKTSFQAKAQPLAGIFATEDTFSVSMEAFCGQAETDVGKLKEDVTQVFERVKQVTAYFHGNSRETQPLRLFIIVRDFLGMLEKVCKDLARPLKLNLRG